MARLTAYFSFDQSLLDLSYLYHDSWDVQFNDNVFFRYDGIVVEDVLYVAYDIGDAGYLALLGGSGFRLDGDRVTGGTLQLLGEAFLTADWIEPFWELDGLNIPLVDVYNAAATFPTDDDRRVMDRALAGNDSFDLSFQADRAFGLGGNDTLFGNGGDDTLSGGVGNDDLYGGQGGDTLMLDAGDDRLFGGAGRDWVVMQGDRSVRIDLAVTVRQNTGLGQDVIAGVENAQGGAGNDTLLGDAQANVLRGGGGNDLLQGRRGNDRLEGAFGNDRLEGNEGDDALFGGAGNDTVLGGFGNDTLFMDAGWDVLDGGPGIDWLAYDGPAAIVVDLARVGPQATGLGMDRISGIEHLRSGGGNDRLLGNAQNNVIQGGNGNDWIFGQAGNDQVEGQGGNDRLDGGAGADRLFGGLGNDMLIGGAGPDLLTGGAGADLFVFRMLADSRPGQADRIVDFRQGMDRIDLSAMDANHLRAGNQAFDLDGLGPLVPGQAGQLTFRHVTTSTLRETQVMLDADGDGRADALIRLTGIMTLTEADFIL